MGPLRTLVLSACALVVVSAEAGAGANPAAQATLSWTQTGATADIAHPAAVQSLYVRFSGLTQFKGAEVDVIWSPADAHGTCAALAGSQFRTSADCTFLNRGTAIPIVDTDEPGRYHMAWANTLTSQCEAGIGVVLQFDFSSCTDFAGCYALAHAFVLDDANAIDECTLVANRLTVAGGGLGSCGPESKSATWGHIKSIFAK